MKIVKAFSPGGREPARLIKISNDEAKDILTKRPHVEQCRCSFAFADALGLKAPVGVLTGDTETLPHSRWELVVSETGTYFAEDGFAPVGEGEQVG